MDTKSAIMQFKSRKKESGQALVLIAMLIVILLGFLGLAIDGGGMFLLWRDAQNAVDSAALQAAFAYCTSNSDFTTAVQAGMTAAEANGFDNNTVDNWVTIIPAPASRRPSNVYVTDTNAIMLVSIRAVKPSYFIQLVYGGPLEVNVDTVGICSPAAESLYEGYSIYAMGSNGLCRWAANEAGPAKAQISVRGSQSNYFGPVFTNGNISYGGGGGGITLYDGAEVDIVGGSNGTSMSDPNGARTDAGGQVTLNPTTQINTFPPLFTISQFLQSGYGGATVDGQYWLEARSRGTAFATIVNGTGEVQIGGNNVTLEGLYVNPTGGIKVKTNTRIGSRGITLVAATTVSMGGVDTSLSGASWQPFVAGLTAFASENSTTPNCEVNTGTAAISFAADDVMGFGILYAPNGGITMSASRMAWCGALIGNAIDNSGSTTWIFGQTVPNLSRLQSLGVPSTFHQYAERTCDYINNDTPPYYGLGD